MIGWIAAGEVFRLLVEFEELKVRDVGVEPGEAGEGCRGGSAREDEAQAPVEAHFAERGCGGVIATVLQPEDPDGEDAIDGGLGFGGVDGDDGPGLLTPGEHAAGVGGAEGALEIHGGAKAFGAEVRKGAEEDAVKQAEVALAGGLPIGGSAEAFVGDEIEVLGAGPAEALGGETQGVGSRGDAEDAANEVAIVGPEVKGSAVVVGGEGVAGFAKVEEGAAVFEQECVGVIIEEGLEGGGDVGGGLGCEGLGCEGLGCGNCDARGRGVMSFSLVALGSESACCGSGCSGRHGPTVAGVGRTGDSTFGGGR